MPHNEANFTMMGPVARRRASDAQRRQEGLLRYLDAPHLLHPALARLLPLEQLPLARYVPTVALRGDVLAVGAHRLAGDDPPAHRRLHRDLELLARSEEHTSELQSRQYLVCRLLLEK